MSCCRGPTALNQFKRPSGQKEAAPQTGSRLLSESLSVFRSLCCSSPLGILLGNRQNSYNNDGYYYKNEYRQQNKSRHRNSSVRKNSRNGCERAGRKSRFTRCRCTGCTSGCHHDRFRLSDSFSGRGVPGFLILYLFLFDLSIGRLPVIFTNFPHSFSCFSQNPVLLMQFRNFNPANLKKKARFLQLPSKMRSCGMHFARDRQKVCTHRQNRHNMITEGRKQRRQKRRKPFLPNIER